MIDIKPCGHYLVIEHSEVSSEQVSAGGIVLSTGSESRKREQSGSCYAKVISVGQNCWAGHYKLDGEISGAWCTEGDSVMVAQHSGQHFPVPDNATDDEKKSFGLMRLIKDDDVLAVVGGG